MTKRTVAFAIIGMALVAAACGSSKSGSSSSSSDNTFVLGEFSITPPKNALHPGRVTITADNSGGEVHELVIVRATSADALAKAADGSVDEDKIADADKVDEIEGIAAGSRKSKAFDLASGTYVAFCNIVDEMMGSSSSTIGGHSDMTSDSGMGSGAGHVHFAEGMHVTFTVS